MKNYWSYVEKERSEFTEEQVQALLDVELMEKGVLKVKAPELRKIDVVEIPRTRIFRVDNINGRDVAFSTIEQARAFMLLKPMGIDYDWQVSSKVEYPVPIEGNIKEEEIYSRQGVLDMGAQLKKKKADEEHNEKVTEEYREATKKVDRVLNDVWDDWHACRELAAQHAKVRATLEEYQMIADGNKRTAATFLLKAYTEAEVRAAEAWFGETWEAFVPVAEAA